MPATLDLLHRDRKVLSKAKVLLSRKEKEIIRRHEQLTRETRCMLRAVAIGEE
ncbi:MAG TPA: hypothetical protein VI111_11135 [Thermoleophilaceae bacterium]